MKLGKYIFITLLIINSYGKSLIDVVQNNLEKNDAVLSALEAYKSSIEEIGIANSGHLPTLSLKKEYGREFTQTPGNLHEKKELISKSMTLEARLNIFAGYEKEAKINEKIEQSNLAKFELYKKMMNISYSITKAYLDVLQKNQNMEIALKNVELHETTLKKVELKIEGGNGYESDKFQTSSRLYNAKFNLVIAKKLLDNSKITYKQLTGEEADINTMEYPTISNYFNDDKSFNDLDDLDKSVSNNADVLIAEIKYNISEAIYKQKNSVLYPKVDLVANKIWSRNIHGVEDIDDSRKIYLELTYNFFNGGADIKNKKSAFFNKSAAKFESNNIKTTIYEKLKIAYNNFSLLTQQLSIINIQLNELNETRTLYQKDYESAKRTIIDVLNIEQEYNQALVTKTNIQTEYVAVFFELLQLKGTILNYFDINKIGF